MLDTAHARNSECCGLRSGTSSSTLSRMPATIALMRRRTAVRSSSLR
ncbi:Uncharacterised protein [Mycobacterium tuberculosis]|nr:Uncharacterised protein [Mycobacterium tuberculosis]CPC18176.1 Uncharacterised protein [Mycobacterium tuberculosis]